jgi:aspartate racemase
LKIECFSLESEIQKAKYLLKDSESEIPDSVMSIIKFCCSNNIGVILSRNVKVLSCKDARSNRIRLGHKGIPLFDELKSIVFRGYTHAGKEIIIAAHCRGHMNIITQRIVSICSLCKEPEILPEEELKSRFDMQFGTVNPIILDLNSGGTIINIFDVSLTEPLAKCPGTMMTNAGNHTWGIEIDPEVLIPKIRNGYIYDVAEADKELEYYEVPQLTNPKSIGIITGNGPDSGIALWSRINSYFSEMLGEHFLGDISLPKVSIVSLPAMGLSMELDKRDGATLETISEAINKMLSNDVDLLALACHTTHYYTDKIRNLFEKSDRRFISMPETVMNYIKNNNLTDLAIIGINYVANLQEYSAYSELKNFDIEVPSTEVLSKFHEIGYDIKKMKNLYPVFQKFTSLLRTDIKAENIIVALTELSILVESQKKKYKYKNIIDPLDIYGKELSRLSLGLGDFI